MQHNISLEELDESAIDRAAIAVLQLPAWTTVSQRPAGCEERTAMDAIIDELRRTIEKSGVSYAALLDDQIVLAAFSPDKAAVAGNAHAWRRRYSTCVIACSSSRRNGTLASTSGWPSMSAPS